MKRIIFLLFFAFIFIIPANCLARENADTFSSNISQVSSNMTNTMSSNPSSSGSGGGGGW